MNKPRTHLYFTSFLRNPQTVKQLIHFECFHPNQDWTLQMFHAFNVFISIKITIVNILCFYRTRVRSLLVLFHSLTDILLFSQLDCNESGWWRRLHKSCCCFSNIHPDLLLTQKPPTFSDLAYLPLYNNWTFTFWATTAISKAITGLIFWLHAYPMDTTGHRCKIVHNSAR